MKLLRELFHRKIPEVIQVPSLHPMGPYTFAIACALCLHQGREDYERCHKCLCEITSGFEINREAVEVLGK